MSPVAFVQPHHQHPVFVEDKAEGTEPGLDVVRLRAYPAAHMTLDPFEVR
jgi:hypothetical protein